MPERGDNSRHSRIRYTLIFAILVGVYALSLAFIAYPYVKTNLANSDIREHFLLYKEFRERDDYTSMNIFLYGINGPVEVERSIEIEGRDSLHTALEAMLPPIEDKEIEMGLVSYIPRKTSLIGVTNSNGYVFAEFSNDLMFSSDIGRAIEQIERTIDTTVDSQGITIISDGLKIN